MPVIEFGRHVVGCPLRRRSRSTAVRSVLGKEPGVGLKELVPLPLSLGSIHPTQSPAMLNAGGPIHGAVGSGAWNSILAAVISNALITLVPETKGRILRRTRFDGEWRTIPARFVLSG